MQIRSVALSVAIFCCTLAALPASSQVDSSPNIPLPDGPHLASPGVANPEFPLKVRLRIDHNRWEDSVGYYHALGRFTLDASAAVVYNFNYQCSVTFRNPTRAEYQARWLKPGKKLQVLLFDPRENKTRSCNLNTVAHPPFLSKMEKTSPNY